MATDKRAQVNGTGVARMSEELVLDLNTASDGTDPTSWQRCLTIHFAYSVSDAPWVRCCLRIEHGPLTLVYNFLCHSYDLQQFSDGLRQMQAGDVESVTFADYGREVTVGLPGRIAVLDKLMLRRR